MSESDEYAAKTKLGKKLFSLFDEFYEVPPGAKPRMPAEENFIQKPDVPIQPRSWDFFLERDFQPSATNVMREVIGRDVRARENSQTIPREGVNWISVVSPIRLSVAEKRKPNIIEAHKRMYQSFIPSNTRGQSILRVPLWEPPGVTCEHGNRLAAGPHTWRMLHSAAMSFPNRPSMSEEDRMKDFVTTKVRTFACHECAAHGMRYIKSHPIDASSKAAIVMWLCNFHNSINIRTGKPIHDCSRLLRSAQ